MPALTTEIITFGGSVFEEFGLPSKRRDRAAGGTQDPANQFAERLSSVSCCR